MNARISTAWYTFALLVVLASASAAVRAADAAAVLGEGNRITVSDGRLSAEVIDVRLDTLASRLSTLAGVDFVFATPSLASTRVTARVTARPLNDGVHSLLDGYSFTSATHAASGRRRITIHASHTGTVPVMPAAEALAPERVPEVRVHWALSDAIDRETESDEYADEYSLTDAHEAEQASEEDIEDARLEQALRAIGSGDPVSRTDGIDSLVGMADERAGMAIARVASDTGLSPDDRLVATVALANHAADRRFDDEGVMRALANLASDPDMAVAEVAARVMSEHDRRLH